MPILGIWASSIAKTAPDTGSYFPLGEFTLASAQSSVTFSNIPQTYTHLQIRSIQRAVDNLSGDWPYMRFNNISTNTYSWHRLSGSGAAASAGAGSTTNLIRYAFATADGGYTSGNFSGVVIDILDYKNTNKYKTVRVLSGADNNGSGNAYVNLESGLFQSTNAIDRIDLFPYSGNWAINSQFALYGVLA